MRRAVWLAIAFLAARSLAAQGPSADWRTIDTEHFRVHFPKDFAPWARHAAALLEPIHERVTAYVGSEPGRPIEVVVADPAADANGMALPYLDRPAIVLWTSPPASDSALTDFPDWTEMLATHEVAHIVHLVRPATGASAVLARLSPAPFGPLALGSPRWLYEGYATLIEGALTGSGRPSSAFRAMLLRQLALEDKLPKYSELDGGSGWLAEARPYLVGSAFLEWLAARSGEASLRELWQRMAGRLAGGFEASFQEVFGKRPASLYDDDFVPAMIARAREAEQRLQAEGLVAGELALKLKGGTSSLQLSPDGSMLLARRDPSRRVSLLAVWDTRTAKPDDKPGWTLQREDGFSPSDPRWMPDGRRVLFSKRAPDAEGTLRRDLYVWEWGSGHVSRVTRRADVSEGDPAPDGRFAVAVQSRYGASRLVRVDLETGGVGEISADLGGERWPVWSEPRVSPDGKRVAVLLHRGRRWRLVTLPFEGGAAHEVALGGPPLSAPSWSRDGATLFISRAGRDGIAEIVSIETNEPSPAPVQSWTRLTGGAFDPAPTPGADVLYFLDWTATGVNVRRLAPFDRDGKALEVVSPEEPRPSPAPLAEATVPGVDRPYSVWPSQAIRPLLNFSIGPDGDTVQVGVDGADVLGRFHWLAAGSFGNTPGPRGGTAAAAWRGWPVALSIQLFSALEKPGSQSLSPRPALDEERMGGFLQGAWGRPFDWGRLDVDLGSGAASVESFAEDERFSRALGTGRVGLAVRRTTGRWGAALDFEATGSLGETAGAFWSQWAGGVRPAWITPLGTFSISGRWGGTGGSPSRYDLFAVGGSPSTILPPGFDRNRIDSPALPFAAQVGGKSEVYRAALDLSAVPILLYGEWLRAWTGSELRPDPVRAAGAEARLERLIPAEFGRAVTFRVGVAYIDSQTPNRFSTVRGYADLIYRP